MSAHRVGRFVRYSRTAVAVAGALAGGLGQVWGPRAALVAGGCAMACIWIPVLLSPLRHTRELATAS